MAASLVLTVLLGAVCAIFNPGALWVALPLQVAWLIAPQNRLRAQPAGNPHHQAAHGDSAPAGPPLARRTWAFLSSFAGPDDHWLPPDHFQESPRGSVEHYTTPTNIGLFLVSTLSAFDLGYLGLPELAVRLRSTFESMDKVGTLPGAPVELVRLGDAGSAATPLHLHGG